MRIIQTPQAKWSWSQCAEYYRSKGFIRCAERFEYNAKYRKLPWWLRIAKFGEFWRYNQACIRRHDSSPYPPGYFRRAQ